MKFAFSSLAVSALLCIGAATAHNIPLKAHSRECFFETLHVDDKMTVGFQTGDTEFGGSGNLDINFWIEDPAGQKIHSKNSISSDEFTFTAKRDGKYVYCFGNEAWSSNSKEVSFNVHGTVYVPANEHPSDPLELEVMRLSDELAQVKDEQSYIIVRERTHRNTAESTNSRVKWWSLFQLAVLIANGIFQVWWLKRFFEVLYNPSPVYI
ncbi:lin-12 protein 9 suppressor/enhancer [Nannizzia gypsea CBS 118893]|uniref:Lin-12 protein 9 suppressor/enhancer n=1 Tax=Arthroderma gypseum (strain ATCC MYA-4604 / CBS 118893) TaxID=535722 RepID=E4UTQ0_ARTGP|nr:lin-12 protein 9 suppressor/enhancer [Nannizzia gypsea CBS 118893]EFR01543.1 lin-12 protein 9 suppressor/enhancer [Nannizzia gypsea CBS 118893]